MSVLVTGYSHGSSVPRRSTLFPRPVLTAYSHGFFEPAVLHTGVKRSRACSARTTAAARSSYGMHGLRACACAAADINSGARTDPPTRAPTFRGGARRAHWMPPSPPMGAGLVPRHCQYRTGGVAPSYPVVGRPGPPRPTADVAAPRRGLCWRGTSARSWRGARGYSRVLTGLHGAGGQQAE